MKKPWLLFAVGCAALWAAQISTKKQEGPPAGKAAAVAGGHVDFIKPLTVFASGELGYTAGTYQATNAGVTVDGRILLVFKKINGRWLIAAQETVVRDQP